MNKKTIATTIKHLQDYSFALKQTIKLEISLGETNTYLEELVKFQQEKVAEIDTVVYQLQTWSFKK